MNCELKPTFRDAEYRRTVESVVDYTQEKIEILSENLSCINYPEILYSLRKNRLEGANIFVYFKETAPHILDYLKNSDVNLYRIEKPLSEEYIVIDRNTVISSKRVDGYRVGMVTEHGSQYQKIISDIDALRKDNSTKVIAEAKIKPHREKITITKPSQEEVSAYKKLFDDITRQVSKDVIPEKLVNLEESIRTRREKLL